MESETSFWLQRMMWMYDSRLPVKGMSLVTLGTSTVGGIWTLVDMSGTSGSETLLIAVLLGTLLVSAAVWAASGPLRWYVLQLAVRSYVRQHLLPFLTQEKLLLGIGPGGAIAVGMVAKAIREAGIPPPPVLVVDMRYERRGQGPVVAAEVPPGVSIPTDRTWIIQGHVGSGRSLRTLRERFNLHDCPVFAFVISESAYRREKVDHVMAIGTHAILPWPTEMPASG